jgi:hypothetical protein
MYRETQAALWPADRTEAGWPGPECRLREKSIEKRLKAMKWDGASPEVDPDTRSGLRCLLGLAAIASRASGTRVFRHGGRPS